MDFILEKLQGSEQGIAEMAAGIAEMVKDAEDPAAMIAEIKNDLVNERAEMQEGCSEMFATMDTNGDGYLDKNEARADLRQLRPIQRGPRHRAFQENRRQR